MILALVLLPALAGVLTLLVRASRVRRMLLVASALAHGALTAGAWLVRPAPVFSGWLALDALGLFFLSVVSVLFVCASLYATDYLARGAAVNDADSKHAEGLFFRHAPESVFCACLLFFLATMSFVCVSMHFGLVWVAVEATTLASAPLIYFHRSARSLEATWKYLLLCSVGIALALLGNFFLAVASSPAAHGETGLLVGNLVRRAPTLHVPWLKAAFLFFLVGYGTKMGLAPLHTWLPDAHSESPSLVSALLSGALLNCAFLGILRAFGVCAAAGLASFAQELLVVFGLLSMAFAAVFLLGQSDYKRMLAYSSVEHMGILALGVGIGGAATFGALLHALNHSLTKALLFLAAGNILAVYRTKAAADVRGMLRVLPVTGVLWVAGFLAICGSPPFGAFLSEFTILKAALDARSWGVAAAYLLLLGVIFLAMARTVLAMAQGEPVAHTQATRESWLSVTPPACLAVGVLVLGLYVPPALTALLREASRLIQGGL